MAEGSNVKVRKGTEADIEAAFALIKELAAFENAPQEVTNTVEMMAKDGFGENPVYGFFVAERDKAIIGLSLYYYRYSTWKGKRLYLEDIVVTQAERGKGVGKLLFEATVAFAKAQHCTGMMWQVLDWNQSAIDFYKKYYTHFDNEWINCHLNF